MGFDGSGIPVGMLREVDTVVDVEVRAAGTVPDRSGTAVPVTAQDRVPKRPDRS